MSTKSLEVDGFPLCCKALIVSGFPNGDRGNRSIVDNKDLVRREVQRIMDESWKSGKAVLVATTTTNQTTAEEVLKELGWYCSGPMNKLNYLTPQMLLYSLERLKIRLWWCQLDEFEWVEDKK